MTFWYQVCISIFATTVIPLSLAIIFLKKTSNKTIRMIIFLAALPLSDYIGNKLSYSHAVNRTSNYFSVVLIIIVLVLANKNDWFGYRKNKED